MQPQFLLGVAFSLALGFSHALPSSIYSHHSMEDPNSHALVSTAVGDEWPAARYLTQRQDNFDGSNTNTWQQAYYVNDTYWRGASSGAPVFLCVGGEGPALDGSAVVSSVHCNDAVEWMNATGAIMFAVEHRYYGCHNMSACPVKSFAEVSALRYQSSRQALADLAQFHAFITKEYGLTSANKWVTWGGSYPGMLAAWARLKFPHLFHAAVSSSAPVKAQLDMIGYFDVVAEVSLTRLSW
jgi:serine protease 16